MMRGLRTALGSVCLLLVAMSLSVLPLIFSTSWYRFNCHFHERCANLDPPGVESRVHNMGQFFLHREPLAADWDPRGAAHLDDVRVLYGQLALVAAVALCLLGGLLVHRPVSLAEFARGALLLLLIGTLILPVFGVFWEKVFHPVLFDNDLWRTHPGEVLWSLTPRVFFRNSAAMLLTLSASLCVLLWWLGTRRR